MNKRELRKIPERAAEQTTLDTACCLAESPLRYIAHGEVVWTVENVATLCLHFYGMDNLRAGNTNAEFRLFADKDTYITQTFGDNAGWKTGAMDSIIPYTYNENWNSYGWKGGVMLDGPQTEQAIRVITGKAMTVLASLEAYQENIKRNRLQVKHNLIIERIDTQMAKIPKLPKDWNKWLKKTAVPESRYIFYKYKSGNKPMTGFCTCCERHVLTSEARHNKTGLCPNCSEQVTYKAAGKVTSIQNYGQAAILQRISPDEFAVRYFAVIKTFKLDKVKLTATQKVEPFEKVREIYAPKGRKDYGYGTFKTTGVVRWCDDTNAYLTRPSVYAENISEVLAGTVFQYSALKEFAQRYKGAPVNVVTYLGKYKKYPFIEYLVKLKLYQLTNDFTSNYGFSHFINDRGKNIGEVLGVNSENIKKAIELDVDDEALGNLQFLEEKGVQMSAEYIGKYLKVYAFNFKTAVVAMKYATLHQITKYLRGQDKDSEKGLNMAHALQFWWDYTEGCERLKYDLKNEFVLFPKNLRQAHDIIDERCRALDDRKKKRRLKKLVKDSVKLFRELNDRYYYERDGLIITAPNELNDIVAEGHALKHCVGGYAERAAEGKTIILFIRKADAPGKSYYTLEIKDNGSILQCRGLANCGKTKQVESLLSNWQRKISKQTMKKSA